MPQTHTRHQPSRTQSGVALIFALITLVALMLGALALVRNTDTAALVLGNLGFKQDATQSADQATKIAIQWLNANSTALNNDLPAKTGYYASSKEYGVDGVTKLGPIDLTGNQLPSDNTRQLIDWEDNGCSNFDSGTYTTCDLKPAPISATINGNSAQYIILRMCNKKGDYTTDATVSCAMPLDGGDTGASGKGLSDYKKSAKFTSTAGTYFRIIVRVVGLRGSTSFTETIVHF
ncbi:MAG: pilus assembly protein PilX [Aquabacterium sp.]